MLVTEFWSSWNVDCFFLMLKGAPLFKERQRTKVGMPLWFWVSVSSLAFALSKFPHPSHLFSLLCPSGNHPTIRKRLNLAFTLSSSQESNRFPGKWPCFSHLGTMLRVAHKQGPLNELLDSRSPSQRICGSDSIPKNQRKDNYKGDSFELKDKQQASGLYRDKGLIWLFPK